MGTMRSMRVLRRTATIGLVLGGSLVVGAPVVAAMSTPVNGVVFRQGEASTAPTAPVAATASTASPAGIGAAGLAGITATPGPTAPTGGVAPTAGPAGTAGVAPTAGLAGTAGLAPTAGPAPTATTAPTATRPNYTKDPQYTKDPHYTTDAPEADDSHEYAGRPEGAFPHDGRDATMPRPATSLDSTMPRPATSLDSGESGYPLDSEVVPDDAVAPDDEADAEVTHGGVWAHESEAAAVAPDAAPTHEGQDPRHGQAPDAARSELPVTPAGDAMPYLAAGMVLLLAGIVLILVLRRVRSANES